MKNWKTGDRLTHHNGNRAYVHLAEGDSMVLAEVTAGGSILRAIAGRQSYLEESGWFKQVIVPPRESDALNCPPIESPQSTGTELPQELPL